MYKNSKNKFALLLDCVLKNLQKSSPEASSSGYL